MLSRAREIPILVAGVLAGAVVIATELTSDHQDARIVWAVFGPAVGWSFIGFNHSINSFSSQVGTAISSTPPSASGSSGFGGGGFSGGGGGGGGGGSW